MRRLRRRAARIAAAVVALGLIGVAASLLTAAPASAATTGLLPTLSTCKSAPTTQAPLEGAAGFFVTTPSPLPAPGTWTGPSPSTTEYAQYGYAGLEWGIYDLGCVGQVDPTPYLTTAAGNLFLTIATAIVAADNAVHSWASDPAWLNNLNPLVTAATRTIHDTVFTPWAAISLIILAIVLIARAHRADVSGAVTAVAWALLVLALVAGVTTYPTLAGRQVTNLMSVTLNAMDAGFVGPGGQAKAADTRSSLLVGSILYPMWLRGEFGQSTTAAAQRYGPQLLANQALTWQQASASPQQLGSIVQKESSGWEQAAASVKSADPGAYPVLQGKDGSRWTTGILAILLALVTCAFDMFASAVVIVALLSVLTAVIALPALAVVGLHHSMRHVITGLLSRVGGLLVSGILYSAAAGVDSVLTRLLLTGSSHGKNLLPLPLAMLLLLILPIALYVAIRRARGRRAIPRAALVVAGLLAARRWTGRAAREGAEEGAARNQPPPANNTTAWVDPRPPRRPPVPPLGGGPGGGPTPPLPPGGGNGNGPYPPLPPGGGNGRPPLPAGTGSYYAGSQKLGDTRPAGPGLTAYRGPDGSFSVNNEGR